MIDFTPHPDISLTKSDGLYYKANYEAIFEDIAKGKIEKLPTYRWLILNDLWFIIYFVMKIKNANHPFVVRACQDVEEGPKTGTLDIWGRYHFKSTIITIAETVQYHLRNPEHCTCIFSYKKPAAEKFLDSIRKTYEEPIMRACFPDLLYENPAAEATSWSLENGITINRENRSRPQKTVQASGLVEGMVTGDHFERRIYDDIETFDMRKNVEQMNKCFDAFDMSKNLGTGQDEDIDRLVGTFYSHNGPLVRLRDQKKADGTPKYHFRKKPSTDDGTRDGKPVLVSVERLEELKTEEHFVSQHLCDPNPKGERELNGEFLQVIEHEFVPKEGCATFMIVDPAGDGTEGCDWAMLKVVVKPDFGNLSLSACYITDMIAEPMSHAEAIASIRDMYLRGEYVNQLGIEDDRSTTHIHAVRALKEKGRRLSEDNGNLVLLKHRGRNKDNRIASAIQWPLCNMKIYISKRVSHAYQEKMKMEMNQFPFGTKDSLDALAYLWDLINDFRFQRVKKKSRQPNLKPVCSTTGY